MAAEWYFRVIGAEFGITSASELKDQSAGASTTKTYQIREVSNNLFDESGG